MFTGEYASEVKSYGKIINSFHTNWILGYLKNHGGKVILGGKGDPDTCKIEPTIVLNPSKDSELYNNEVFGPILKVTTFKVFDDVITEMNRREKPLVIYYFGNARKNPNKDWMES